MANIPNRTTVFPAWASTVENTETGIARVTAPAINVMSRVTPAAERQANGIPTNLNTNQAPLVGIQVDPDLWDEHHTVIVNGQEQPEQITAYEVPAGKNLVINMGQTWLKLDEATRTKFVEARADNTVFVELGNNATLNVNANTMGNVHTTPLTSPSGAKNTQYQLGGNNVLSVDGTGIVVGDLGDYGNNAFISANKSTIKLGNDKGAEKGYYVAHGNSTQGHNVTGGVKGDTFEYNFTNGMPNKIGANSFTAKVGSTEPSDADGIQLRKLPAGSKVTLNVSAVRGTGTFPDGDVKLTIKNPAGTTIGTIDATNVNYINLIHQDGTYIGITPKTLGAGGSKTYTIGTTAMAAAPVLSAENLNSAARSSASLDSKVFETTPSMAPINIPIPVANLGTAIPTK